MIRITNPKVVAAIIDCLSLPVSKKCELALLEKTEIIFIDDEFAHPQHICRFDIWSNISIEWWGARFTVMHPMDIGCWEIDCKTGESRYICYYNEEGKIKYGRYYEPSMD